MKAQDVADIMELKGIDSQTVAEPSYEQDGEIVLDEFHHVQVGEDYVILVTEMDGNFMFSAPYSHGNLKAFMAEELSNGF